MRHENRTRLLNAADAWRIASEKLGGRQSLTDDDLVATVEIIMLDELSKLPGEAVHRAVDRGLDRAAAAFLAALRPRGKRP